MTDQLRIADDGTIESQPLTWDGEPLYSVETVQEGLFSTEPFAQMPGQTAMDTEPICKICGVAPAEYPKYATPDMCGDCSDAAWARIDASAKTQPPAIPGYNNVWD